jgi:acetyltransferase-like isoleucine patch superfamily enzyme
MSILGNWLDDGWNQPVAKSWRGRFSNWLGRRLALRHSQVSIDPTSRISSDARINPRGAAIRIGRNCLVSPGAQIQGNVEIGDDSSVQSYTCIVGYSKGEDVGKIRIGNGVRIAAHGMIIAGNHNFADTSKPIRKQGVTAASITIEDDVWIGGSVNIVAGVTIGHGSVIGAGSVVTKDIPPMSVAVGVPARVIKTRTENQESTP